MSIEALAMAGVDFASGGMAFEELNNKQRNYTAEYLLSGDEEAGDKKSEDDIRRENDGHYKHDGNADDRVKAQLIAWSKDVALLTKSNFRQQSKYDRKRLGAKCLPKRLKEENIVRTYKSLGL